MVSTIGFGPISGGSNPSIRSVAIAQREVAMACGAIDTGSVPVSHPKGSSDPFFIMWKTLLFYNINIFTFAKFKLIKYIIV